MRIRRPLAALLTTLALFGGGTATLTACGDPAGLDRNDGTTDDTGGVDELTDEERGDLPENHDAEVEQDVDQDRVDPD